MSFVKATFSNASLWAFMTGFGEGVNDLRCDIADMKLTGWVDTATHYFTKSIGIHMEDYKSGIVYVPDVHKVGAFLKTCKEDNTVMQHVGNTLTLTNGNDEFSTPTHDHIMSYATVDRAKLAISMSKDAGWMSLGRAEIQAHGNMSMEELRGISSMTKVVGKDAPVRVSVEDQEMTITAGTQRGARMTRQIDIDTTFAGSCETVFGSHFPKLANIMPSGTVIFHMGLKSALILRHSEVSALLVLKHQEGADQ
tara:strand:+ start:5077 stop:5832 length:756 start_codon:yes stop_codon:yes gene_type:complete